MTKFLQLISELSRVFQSLTRNSFRTIMLLSVYISVYVWKNDCLSHHSLMLWFSYGPSQSPFSDGRVTIRDILNHHSLVPWLLLGTISIIILWWTGDYWGPSQSSFTGAPLSLSLFCSLFSHAHTIYSLLLWTPPLSVSVSLPLCFMCTQPIW